MILTAEALKKRVLGLPSNKPPGNSSCVRAGSSIKMVAKLKAKPKATNKAASLASYKSKKKKNNCIGRASGDNFEEEELSSGDQYENESFREERLSKRSRSGEDGGSDNEADANYLLPVSNSDGQERDIDFDEDVQDLPYAVRDEELEALDKEYKELQAQELDMLHNLKGRSDEEMLKGQAVRTQKALWDKALGVRILLQKPFSNANRLPLGDVKMGMSQSREVEGAFAKLNATTTKTLLSLHQTLKVLLNQVDSMSRVSDNNSASKDDEELTVLDDLNTIWEQMSASYTRFAPFRNNSVDRWQRKTQLSTGAAASKSKLRAFNQSISQQIEIHMRDFSRMLQRMRLRRSSVNVIGTPAAQAEDDILNNNGDDFSEGTKDFSGDPELIDDTEFYQELLREFLESSDPSSLGALYPVRNLRHKNRKVVDRRASKGRKIRYNVHEKIVNFMVPIPTNFPPMAEKLFSTGIFQGGSAQPLHL
ncbi:hypothetical protein GOP47_0026377 [Adiantum capillus-veneris]|nr:hypothetical protein GOP47_0026377 [Adiantum capillus-veneris]